MPRRSRAALAVALLGLSWAGACSFDLPDVVPLDASDAAVGGNTSGGTAGTGADANTGGDAGSGTGGSAGAGNGGDSGVQCLTGSAGANPAACQTPATPDCPGGDVTPKLVQPNQTTVGTTAPSVAFAQGRFGVLTDGNITSCDTQGFANAGQSAVTTSPIAASDTRFGSFIFPLSSGPRLGRIDLCGYTDSAFDAPALTGAFQPLLIGGPGGSLVIAMTGAMDLYAFWLSDLGNELTPALKFGDNPACCTVRAYAGTFHQGKFYVAWDASDKPETRMTELSACAAPGPTNVIISKVGERPRFVGGLASDLVVVAVDRSLRVDTSFNVLDTVMTANPGTSSCGYASSGNAVYRACLNTSSKQIDLSVLDFVGQSWTPLKSLAVTAATSAAGMAWDSKGLGIFWLEDAGLAYARVCP
jgi:hypothetical protein